jgi:hypothetical protein
MISSATLDGCLVGLQFPVGSVEISERALSNKASCAVDALAELRNLPAKRYGSKYEVMQALSEDVIIHVE